MSTAILAQYGSVLAFDILLDSRMEYQAGGHAHLEQPPTAMSWLEECVKAFLTLTSAWCVVIAACAYGKDWYKQWMFASSWQKISELGQLCTRPHGSHVSLVGTLSDTGEYLSRQTACYPEALATAFATLVAPLVSQSLCDWKWDDTHQIPPVKSIHQPPFGQEDGGGLPSNPDWSLGDRVAKDVFGPLRKEWVQRILIIVWTNFWYNSFPRQIILPHLFQRQFWLLSDMTWNNFCVNLASPRIGASGNISQCAWRLCVASAKLCRTQIKHCSNPLSKEWGPVFNMIFP